MTENIEMMLLVIKLHLYVIVFGHRLGKKEQFYYYVCKVSDDCSFFIVAQTESLCVLTNYE